MLRYILVSLLSGVLFAVMDGLINANPLAQRLYAVFRPIAKSSVNVLAGVAIDLAWGFALAAIFLHLYPSLPGQSALVKGVSFALLVWFLRVVMGVAGQWMMFNVPPEALVYSLVAGLVEMLALGVLYSLALRPC